MARNPEGKYKMLLIVDTRLFGQNYKTEDEVELNGIDADRLEARRIAKVKPDSKPKKQPKKKKEDDRGGSEAESPEESEQEKEL